MATTNLEKALGETKLGVDAKKEEDFSNWYIQVRTFLFLALVYTHDPLDDIASRFNGLL